jgi:hypothetical protein
MSMSPPLAKDFSSLGTKCSLLIFSVNHMDITSDKRLLMEMDYIE